MSLGEFLKGKRDWRDSVVCVSVLGLSLLLVFGCSYPDQFPDDPVWEN